MYLTVETARVQWQHTTAARAHYALPTQNLKSTELFSVVYLMILSDTEDYTVR